MVRIKWTFLQHISGCVFPFFDRMHAESVLIQPPFKVKAALLDPCDRRLLRIFCGKAFKQLLLNNLSNRWHADYLAHAVRSVFGAAPLLCHGAV